MIPAPIQSFRTAAMEMLLGDNAVERLADAMPPGFARILLVTSPRGARSEIMGRVRALLGTRIVTELADVAQHSSLALVERGAKAAREARVDGILALGGGSVSDTAKAISLSLARNLPLADIQRSDPPADAGAYLPLVAVATTASAGEVTPALGIRAPSGHKLLFRDFHLVPRLVVLDSRWNTEVPVDLMARTSMNALAHCVEGLYSPDRSFPSDGLALHGARLLFEALPKMMADPLDSAARASVLGGAHLSGHVLGNARVAIHHALCHALGAIGGLSHGAANAIMLPHVMRFNAEAAAQPLAAFGRTVAPEASGDPVEAGIAATLALQTTLKVPIRLRDEGLDRRKLPAIAADTFVARGTANNPRRVSGVAEIEHLLNLAW